MDDEELIVRLVHPNHCDSEGAIGDRLEPGCLQSNDYKPTPSSYGASLYVLSALPGGVKDLESACEKWTTYGLSIFKAKELAKQGLKICKTPMDCDNPSIADAHASLLGVTPKNRDAVVEVLDKNLTRLPVRRR